MAKKKTGKSANSGKSNVKAAPQGPTLHPDAKKSIWAIVFLVCAVIFTLAGFASAGPVGGWLYKILHGLLGVGYFILPITFLLVSGVFFMEERKKFMGTTLMGAALLILSVLGLIDIFMSTPDAAHRAGWLGVILGSLKLPFGRVAAAIIDMAVLAIAIIMTANVPLRMPAFARDEEEDDDAAEKEARRAKDIEKLIISGDSEAGRGEKKKEDKKTTLKGQAEEVADVVIAESKSGSATDKHQSPKHFADENYVAPPLDLLSTDGGKPTTGDLRANANVIKRTLESFGIPVEMGEINIGPKVTRYTLKPAEGVKLSRITALAQDLALVLAAHPIRIEAPIPGKSLVGIEVPNKTAALVRLGALMGYKEFQDAGSLGFALGRDVTGEPVFANIEKMPHLLIAGATGSGKSVVVHSLLVSLLYKNSPATLRCIMIDPKRVELSTYEGIPHLISPVITENKKAIGVFRWALAEMDRRYDVLLKAGNRDIKSYNAGHKEEPLPSILIVVDELADLMSTFGREVEGSIVRLAQMARATGIHLVLATQRPSVEVITGLIKANIPARIALQVASQIDSRTILDAAGAEKLLGGGDLLFTSAELSQPRRIQGSYITESEIGKVSGFIRENNATPEDAVEFVADPHRVDIAGGAAVSAANMFDQFGGTDGDDDDLYTQAVETVISAKKASASLLQRRLKVGYARAARLLDLMEERGVIGPGEGAKPREVYATGAEVEGVSDGG
jgi:S-DNA-T family DNA segregation ATPase FtsK/SpoIIIE